MARRLSAALLGTGMLFACDDPRSESSLSSGFHVLCPSAQAEGSLSGLAVRVGVAGPGTNTTVTIEFGDGTKQVWQHAHHDSRPPEGFGGHRYDRPGTYRAVVTVRDAEGRVNRGTCRIAVRSHEREQRDRT